MPLRGEIDSNIPQIQEPIAYDENGTPIFLNERYRYFLETLWQRSGGFEDETFANDAQIADILGQIAESRDRLSAVEQLIQQDRSIDAALEELQNRVAAIENLPTIQENADVAGQIEAIQLGLRSVEEQVFTAPRGIDVVTNDEVAGTAGIEGYKITNPFVKDLYNAGGSGNISQGSGETTLAQVELTVTDIPARILFVGTVAVFRNDGVNGEASASGLTFTVRARISDADMSATPTAGNNNVLATNSAVSSGSAPSIAFPAPSLPINVAQTEIAINYGYSGKVYLALTGQVTGGSSGDVVNLTDDTTLCQVLGTDKIRI